MLLHKDEFKQLQKLSKVLAKKSEPREVLKVIHFAKGDETFTAEATDSYALAKIEIPINKDPEPAFDCCSTLPKAPAGFEDVEVKFSEEGLIWTFKRFKEADQTVITPISKDVSYPDSRKLIPENGSRTIKVSTEILKKALDAATTETFVTITLQDDPYKPIRIENHASYENAPHQIRAVSVAMPARGVDE